MSIGRAAALCALSFGVSSGALAQTPPSGQLFEYDMRGRLIKVTYQDCSTIEFRYDLHGNRETRTVTPGSVVNGLCVANTAPLFTSSAIASALENSSGTVYTATANDAEGHTVSFSITGGADADKFSLDPTTGALSFLAAPDFETPTDTGSNNTYDVTLDVTDGGASSSISLAFSVTDANEIAPVWSSSGAGSLNENTSGTFYTAQASDADSSSLTFSISGGTDSSKFSINASSGALSFVSAPNFELPTDSGTNNIYNVTLRVSDGTFTADRAVTVTVNDVNDVAPSITSAATSAGSEGNFVNVHTITATDVDSAASTYSIVGGADQALFTINASTGQVGLVSAPDYENPSDSGANNVYNATLRASDGTNHSDQAFALTIVDADDESAVWTSSTTGSANEGSTGTIYTASATDVDTASLTYSINGGNDAAKFSINSSSGALSFNTAPDFENPTDSGTNNVYNVTLRAADGIQGTNRSVAITVDNINDITPSWTSGTVDSVAENSTGAFYTASTNDADGPARTYSIVGGTDASKFTINASSGALSFQTPPNFESPSDGGANNIYNVTLRASDGSLTADRSLAVTVNDVNDVAPSWTSFTTDSVIEGSTSSFYTASVSDIDGPATTFSVAGGADASLFTINPNTGQLSFITAPNFEAPTDSGANNIYDLWVGATDGVHVVQQVLAVTVTDINDLSPIWTSQTTGSAAENSTSGFYTATATDADSPTVTFSVAGGADSSKFTINPTTGALSFVSAPNYESPTDSGANNVYDVILRASDGQFTKDQAVAISVTNVNDVSPSWISSTTDSVSENSNGTFYVAEASDADSYSVTYSIVGGADSALFNMGSSSGWLSFKTSPNFESPIDSGANNVYNLTLRASDGTLTTDRALTVTVNNTNDVVPSWTSATTDSVAENTTSSFYNASTSDADGAVRTYSIVGGADSSKFTITSAGALRFISGPNYESPTDSGSNNVYNVTLRANDGVHNADRAIAVTVTNTNDVAPSWTSSTTDSVAENTSGAFYTATTSDADGPARTYSIVGGSDASKFTINSSSGALSFISAPNYESPTDSGTNNVYNVTLRASDGSNTVDRAVAVTVTNTNDVAPSWTSGTTDSVAENTSGTFYTATTNDADGRARSYSIVGGADASKFSINSSSGALSFVSAPNYESPTDSGSNNVYNVTLRASDGTHSVDRAIAVSVTNTNDIAPSWTSSTTDSVAENTTSTFYNAATNDADGPARTYSIVGGNDASKFSITSAGALRFVSGPNYESPTDSGSNNVYNVTLRASDGAHNVNRGVAVTVTNVNDVAPSWTSSTTDSVAENSSGTFYTAAATDADSGSVSYSINGGVDASKFSINSSSGALSFNSSPDYENPTDSGSNNVYNVTLRASDGSLTTNRNLAVTVTNVVENSGPTANDDNWFVQAGGTVSIPVLVNDSDPDGDTLTITSITGLSKGYASITHGGTRISFTAYSFSNGPEVFTYTISDGNGHTATATVDVEIAGGGGGGFPF
ncbi:MAG: cadherin domain-containing protein [Maricaulis sp.]|nr:cadherin domain-containing protein [Maricaulis sp.]